MLLNDNNKKNTVDISGSTSAMPNIPKMKNINSMKLDLSDLSSFANMDTVMAAEMDKRLSIGSEGSIIPKSGFTSSFPLVSSPQSTGFNSIDTNIERRSSFDTNIKIGSLAHSNDPLRKSPPFLSTVPEFKQPFTDSSIIDNTDNTLTSFLNSQHHQQQQPPLSSSSLFSSTNSNNLGVDGFDNLISPLTPQKNSFSDSNNIIPNSINNLSQEGYTSPLSKPNEYTFQFSPSKTTHRNSTSVGIMPNIEEFTLDNNESRIRTKSAFEDVWNNKTSNVLNDNINTTTTTTTNNNLLTQQHPKSSQSSGAYTWASPPLPDFAPLRRYSYDASSATTFIPLRNNNAIGNDYNIPNNYDLNTRTLNYNNIPNNNALGLFNPNGNPNFSFNNNNEFETQQHQLPKLNSNNMYSRHASYSVNMYPNSNMNMNMNMNMNDMNSMPIIVTPTKEQVMQSMEHVSNYLGTPLPEILNIENYLSYLNNSSLPQLTLPIELSSSSSPSSLSLKTNDFELVACCFKNARIDIFHITSINKHLLDNLKIGDLVIVEADRGRDLGKVVKLNVSILEARLLRYAQYLGRKAALSKDDELHKKPILNFPKPVLRYARSEELITIDSKINDEIRAVDVCQNKVREYNLNMQIVDAEYQWDMKKLTFYYKSEVRIDFRDLVKELFRIYKIRIWMSKQGGIC